MEQRGIPRAAHRRQLPASQHKALMVVVSGRPTALRECCETTKLANCRAFVRSAASKLKQHKCAADGRTRATQAPRRASHRIASHRSGSLPLSPTSQLSPLPPGLQPSRNLLHAPITTVMDLKNWCPPCVHPGVGRHTRRWWPA